MSSGIGQEVGISSPFLSDIELGRGFPKRDHFCWLPSEKNKVLIRREPDPIYCKPHLRDARFADKCQDYTL
jgi:hypothetical protein